MYLAQPQLIRTTLIAGGLGIAVYVGVQLGGGSVLLPGLLLCGLGAAVLLAAFPRSLEAWLLSIAAFGFIIGNRGFAQFSPLGSVPLFPGELILGCCLALLALRMVQTRTIPFRMDGLTLAILAFVLYGLLRLAVDLPRYGMLAIRDNATFYYALYFVIGLAVAKRTQSGGPVRVAFIAAFAVLPVVYLINRLDPSLLVAYTSINGVPLIFIKPDLGALSAVCGALFSFILYRRCHHPALLLIFILCTVTVALSLSRASLLAYTLCFGLLALTPTRSFVFYLLFGLLLAGAGTLAYYTLANGDFYHSRLYAMIEQLRSVTDIFGTGEYETQYTASSGDNNRFRLVWWETLFLLTLREAPLFGFGFGSDISTPFVLEYFKTDVTGFTTRSPHNIFLTLFARSGLIGLTLFLLIVAGLGGRLWKALRGSREAGEPLPGLEYLLMALALLVGGTFGVVLEGPMGAVLFWTLLGLGCGTLYTELEQRRAQMMRGEEAETEGDK